MKLLIITLSVFLLSCQETSVKLNKIEKQALKKEAITLVKKFGGQLKPQLKKALKSKGPMYAVKVCAKKAPEIAKKINANNSDWNIKRVSLKNRNPNAKPDSWEEKVLKMFNDRHAKGESAKKMAYSEVVNGKFRFMKAQGTEKVCLTCHSKNVAQPIKDAIHKYYPNDKATGYSLGDIRGAFSLTKKL
ncbi:Cytochrome c family protein [hydrothermal vent metagenome]|uniref:Cytochrome c family protein n=1 Tax=hydrothermal vent metagenome TaxID=652676 RepID=A0A1W1CVQ7_9ZZZZ